MIAKRVVAFHVVAAVGANALQVLSASGAELRVFVVDFAAGADNAVIYATSNRRHIIKESFSDREGDDVHRNDTLQETLSLSERFGLVVTYSKPNKALYLTIVKKLAEKFDVRMDEKELEIKAEAFALKKGNRSARCAEQFINSLL